MAGYGGVTFGAFRLETTMMSSIRISLPLLASFPLAAAAVALVTVTSPNGGENLRGQRLFQVDWFGWIDHGPSVTYDLEFSPVGDATWDLVVTGLANTSSKRSTPTARFSSLPPGAIGRSVNVQAVIVSSPNLGATQGIHFTVLS